MVDRLSNLIGIFKARSGRTEPRTTTFWAMPTNTLMQHCLAVGKEQRPVLYVIRVSRIMAKVVGISCQCRWPRPPQYDPTCGSGPLLKVAAGLANTSRWKGREMT